MFYKINPQDTARFALGELGAKNLIVFGVNPSTATETSFDQTIRRVQGYSREHEFDGWLMLNLYPQRTTDPRGLHTEVDLALHAENMQKIEEVLGLTQDYTLCAAWGNLMKERSYLGTCLECINEIIGERNWHSIGEPTKEGHPRHPLYVRAAVPLQSFDMTNYLQRHAK